MKKIFLAIFTTLFLMPFMVSASETDPYYTNMNGAELTEEQYNNLLTVFSKDTIATMTVDAINDLKDREDLVKYETTKYIQTDEFYDFQGNLLTTLEKEVSEDEAIAFTNKQKNVVQNRSYTDTHQTTMKRLTITLSPAQGLDMWVTITNTWLSIPSVKSYDVIATRLGVDAAVNKGSISGYQRADGTLYNYNVNSDGTQLTNRGLGISMNIADAVSSSLECSMSAQFSFYSTSYFEAFGTYQHATSTVTLAQSKNYSFGDGYGRVLVFNSSVAPKYDAMGGVRADFDWLGIL